MKTAQNNASQYSVGFNRLIQLSKSQRKKLNLKFLLDGCEVIDCNKKQKKYLEEMTPEEYEFFKKSFK